MEYKSFMEALKGKQHKLDKNKNGKVDAHDFKLLRKEEEELAEAADQHKVMVTVSDPNHTAVSMRKEKIMKRVIVSAKDKDEAHAKAADFYKKKGFKVHDTEYHSAQPKSTMKTEAVEEDVDRVERSDYKTTPAGRKTHKQIDFKNGENQPAPQREEVELEEMSDAQMKKREDYVKGMKKNISGFKAKYGERAKDVMYATATKMAMKEEAELNESHFKVGDEVVCKASGMEGEVVKVDPKEEGKYYTVKREDGKTMKYAPDELKLEDEDEKEIDEAKQISEGAYERAEENKRSADSAKKQGDMFAHHMHMADHHGDMSEWHSSKGRHSEADKHADKSEEHQELAMKHKMKKEEIEVIDEKSEQARRNKTMKNMMDASRGARYKVQNKLSGDAVRDWDGKHKTAQAQNKAIGRALRNEENDTMEKTEMLQSQLHFIKYACEEILDYVEQGGEVEEWYQVKVAKSFSEFESLHSFMEGESRRTGMKEETELDEAMTPQQKTDFDRMMAGAMKRADYNTKWKKPLKSDAKVIYGKNVKEELELDEAVSSGNPGRGYHGEHDSDKADSAYSKAHSMVKKVAGESGHLRDAKKPNVMVKHYLDSQHGRHLKGNENAEYIKKDFGKFKKTYKPEMHEGVDFDEQGNLMAEKLKFSDFIAKINEQLLEYESNDSGVYRHTKKATYGTSYQGDDDEDDKPKKAASNEPKRGRGRPAGSYGGSYKARSDATKAAAAAKAAATKAANKKK